MAKQRKTTPSSYNHLLRRSDVLQEYLPLQNRENLMPQMYRSMYLGRGFGRHPRHDCLQSKLDYMPGD